MGKRGPKPQPTAALKLRGSWRARAREKQGEPQIAPVTASPQPPAHLGDVGKAEWNRVAPGLTESRVLTELDLGALALACESLEQYRAACSVIADEGQSFSDNDGNIKAHPLLRERHQAWSRYTKGLAEFGLTPSSRAGVKVEQKSAPKIPTRQRA